MLLSPHFTKEETESRKKYVVAGKGCVDLVPGLFGSEVCLSSSTRAV